MKFSVKALIATVAMSALIVTPVLATETNLDAEVNMIINHENATCGQITSYLATDNGCGAAAIADHAAHAAVFAGQVSNYVKDEEANYIKYLQGVVVNKKETERIKAGNVTAINELAKVNPTLAASMLPAAQAEYEAAVNDRVAAEAAIPAAQARFAELNIQLATKYFSLDDGVR